ncbi:hypothetical protein ILYODFUR_020940, partial [Ilyodon furcidens]
MSDCVIVRGFTRLRCHQHTSMWKLVLVVFRFIQDRVVGAAHSVETPRLPSPQTPLPATPGGAQDIPRPAKRQSLRRVLGRPWASSLWDVPGTPPEEGVQEASGIDARSTSTGSSRCGGAA